MFASCVTLIVIVLVLLLILLTTGFIWLYARYTSLADLESIPCAKHQYGYHVGKQGRAKGGVPYS